MFVIYGKTRDNDSYHVVRNDSQLSESAIARMVGFPAPGESGTYIDSSGSAFVKLLDDNLILLGVEYGEDAVGRRKPLFVLTTFSDVYDRLGEFLAFKAETATLERVVTITSDPDHLSLQPPSSALDQEFATWLSCVGHWIGENPVSSDRWNQELIAVYRDWLLRFGFASRSQVFDSESFRPELLVELLEKHVGRAPFHRNHLAALMEREKCFGILTGQALDAITLPCA